MGVSLKLEHCANIKVFEGLQHKLEMFKERAGFSIKTKSTRMTDVCTSLPWSYKYMYSNPAAISISSWLEDPNSSLPPTWRSFLQILREPGMNLCNLADQIEQALEFTGTHKIQEEPDCKLN